MSGTGGDSGVWGALGWGEVTLGGDTTEWPGGEGESPGAGGAGWGGFFRVL